MPMYSFKYAPCQGHMDMLKRIYAYMNKMSNFYIQVHTEDPDESALTYQQFDWKYSVYGDVKELLTDNAPKSLGNYVRLTHYVNANLLHDQLTGFYITGILHLFKKYPVNWYYKKHITVDKSTYDSEFFSSRKCAEKNIYLRNNIIYLGVSIQ